MKKLWMRPLSVLALILGAVALPAQAACEPEKEDVSAAAVIVDAVFLRPIGVAATAIGAGLFVAQLPFDLIFWTDPAIPGKALVATPAEWTFARRLGQECK